MVDFKPSLITGDIEVSGAVGLSRLTGNTFASVGAISSSTETTIVSRTAGATLNTNVVVIQCSGDCPATWRLFIDTVQIAEGLSGTNTYEKVFFYPFPLGIDPSSVLDVKAEHFFSGTATLSASIHFFESTP